MPRGEYYPTGYDNDEGREIYFKDLRELNIPNLAKFSRTHTEDIFFIGVVVVIAIDVLTKRSSN